MIFALAGHVDHGKTSLIRALTGIDTNRSAEEKRRGMTIDLGFAYGDVPNGDRIGFIDVPGHERFLANMLAGVLGTRAALLVIAADDGPMPQTLEHLAILRLIGIRDVTVALTKIDAVDAHRLGDAKREVSDAMRRFGYADAEILTVSSVTGAGIPRLLGALQEKAAVSQPPTLSGGFRLAIDRGFVLPGTGLVVTGTVAAGKVETGDTLMLTPARLSARVRSIRVQDRPATAAMVGDRAALAITGARIERAKLSRGDWLVAPHLHAPTSRIDILVRVADGRTLKRDLQLHVHAGTSAMPARALAISGADLAADQEGFVHLALDRPIVALYGDPVMLRDDGSGCILAGGRVIDPFPALTRRSRKLRLAGLEALMEPDPVQSFEQWLAVEGYADPRLFAIARNQDPPDIGSGTVAVSNAFGAKLRDAILQALAAWHETSPEYPGPGQAALLARLSRAYPAEAAAAALRDLVTAGEILGEGAIIRLPSHRAALSELDEARWTRVRSLLEIAGLRAPRLRELMVHLDLLLEQTEMLLDRYIRFGRLVRVSANRCYLPATLHDIERIVGELAVSSEDLAFSAAEFNQRTGVGRNLAIELLEHLDQAGVTIRLGELRHVVTTKQSLEARAIPQAPALLGGDTL